VDDVTITPLEEVKNLRLQGISLISALQQVLLRRQMMSPEKLDALVRRFENKNSQITALQDLLNMAARDQLTDHKIVITVESYVAPNHVPIPITPNATRH
jgi:hypothetical protein